MVYYSRQGHTERMAQAVAEGASAAGVEAVCRPAEGCSLEEVLAADGLAVGSPTYFSNVAWPIKKLIDESLIFYTRGQQLRGRVAGIFTSSATQPDAKDCLLAMEKAFRFHHDMKLLPGIIGVDGESPEQMRQRCLAYGRQLAEAMLRSDK
ncbi:MAG: flavodoxin family protein [Chloroflexi bacterium]|nr:flavodoxin family protein [Chloroflexota bacterium]